LRGEVKSASELSSCSPYITNAEMGKTHSVNGTKLIPDAAAFPCGQIAMMYFTDTYKL
jgi:hypothetical protein